MLFTLLFWVYLWWRPLLPFVSSVFCCRAVGCCGRRQDESIEFQQLPEESLNVIDQAPSTGHICFKYPPKLMTGLSISQLIVGVFSIVLGITSICLLKKYDGPATWCGVMYFMAGVMGIQAAKTKKSEVIISYMVMSILASILCAVPFIYYLCLLIIMGAWDDSSDDNYQRVFPIYIILLILVTMEAIAAIFSSAFGCGAVCYCNRAYQRGSLDENPIGVNQRSTIEMNLKSPSKAMGILSVTQLTCGILSIAFGIASFSLLNGYYGPGIWCGVLYCISGSLGIPAAKKKKRGFIISYMAMSIISTVLCFIPFATYLAYLSTGMANDYDYIDDVYVNPTPNPGKYSVFSILIIVTLVEIYAAISASVYCCRAIHGGTISGQQHLVNVPSHRPTTGETPSLPVAEYSDEYPQSDTSVMVI